MWGCDSTRLTCYGQRIGVICATIGKRVVEEKPFKKPKQRESDQKSTRNKVRGKMSKKRILEHFRVRQAN